MNIHHIQELLEQYNLDAWLLYDFRGSNSIAWKILAMPPHSHCTRRWAVIIPRQGEAIKIVSAIEAHTLAHIPAREIRYANMQEWRDNVSTALQSLNTIAMEYSPNCDLPVVSKVDAGTIEWLRGLGKTITSSADIAQHFQAVWSAEQYEQNMSTAALVRECMMEAFSFMSEKLRRNMLLTEFDVQQHILRFFGENNLISDSDPIVAIGPNASSPHYAPTPENNSVIRQSDVVLVDMWAKANTPGATYADITWMAFAGNEIPERVATLFAVVRDARDAALQLVRTRFEQQQAVYGYEVDDAARGVIHNAGYGQYFIHRTGHNIAEETHGAGANMDNFETHDTRRILPGTSFSIEPGIYIPGDIGLRSEISVVVDKQAKVHVPSNPIQTEVTALL